MLILQSQSEISKFVAFTLLLLPELDGELLTYEDFSELVQVGNCSPSGTPSSVSCASIHQLNTSYSRQTGTNSVNHVTKTSTKPRRSTLKLQSHEYRNSVDYMIDRARNNESVKKCREKNRQTRLMVEQELQQLRAEIQRLKTENQQQHQVINLLLAEKLAAQNNFGIVGY
jgi:Basic region leucine zipper